MTTAYSINVTGTGVAESDATDAYEACVGSLWAATDALADGGATPQGSLHHEADTDQQAASLTPDTWTAATPYALDALITPTVPNGHYYRAIVAGTSHGVTQPTWVTNGGTNTESTGLVWKDQGLLAAAATTAYSISLAGRGVASADATSAFETMVLALRAATDVGAQEPVGSLSHSNIADEDAADV